VLFVAMQSAVEGAFAVRSKYALERDGRSTRSAKRKWREWRVAHLDRTL